MSVLIGLAITSDRIRAVGTQRHRILWAIESERSEDGDLTEAITELLAQAELPRWPRPRVHAVLGPSLSQVRLLSELPPLRDPRLLGRIVAESASRFFVKTSTSMRTTSVRPVDAGTVWAGALDGDCVAAVEAACRALRLRFLCIAPSAVALRHAVVEPAAAMRDGPIRLEVRYDETSIIAARRHYVDAGTPDADPENAVVERLRCLGDSAGRFADAFGAARLQPREPLVLQLQQSGGRGDRRVPRWRLTAGAAACIGAWTAAAVAPTLAVGRAGEDAYVRMRESEEAWRTAMTAEAELQRVTDALGELARFDAMRRPVVLVLEDLTRALPEASAITSIRIDSVAGDLVILTPRAEAVIDALERSSRLTSLEIVGPVAREVVGDRELERVALRFALVTPAGTTVLRAEEAVQ